MRFTSERVRRAVGRRASIQRRHVVSPTLIGAVAITIASCDKTLTVPSTSLPAIEATSTDSAAGTWRVLVLTSPDQVVVPEPTATSSTAYQAEITAVKTAQAIMTDAQRVNVQYWTGAGVLRWN